MSNYAWLILIVAALFEMAWAIGLEYSDGFSNLRATVFTVITLVLSMVLLAKAIQSLPVGTAYAVWTGIGAAGTAVLGIVLFDESNSPARMVCLTLIIGGVAGLKLTSGH
jgi:quaternary ammonium compound-resistance protein SugE